MLDTRYPYSDRVTLNFLFKKEWHITLWFSVNFTSFYNGQVVGWEIGGENIVLGMVHFLRISHINIQKDGSCFRRCSLKELLNFSL